MTDSQEQLVQEAAERLQHRLDDQALVLGGVIDGDIRTLLDELKRLRAERSAYKVNASVIGDHLDAAQARIGRLRELVDFHTGVLEIAIAKTDQPQLMAVAKSLRTALEQSNSEEE